MRPPTAAFALEAIDTHVRARFTDCAFTKCTFTRAEIERTTSLSSGGTSIPQVQLHFSATGVEALVRYPVQLERAAQIDDRVSKELLSVMSPPAHL